MNIHKALHEAPPFVAIAGRTLDLGGYLRLLSALSHFHCSLALVVDAACRRCDLPALRFECEQRRNFLATDLDAIGGIGGGEGPQTVAYAGETWAIGCLYTLVGSTLGGKVIYRQLDYLLPTSAGRSFFAGTREDGERWREFCVRLEVLGAEPESLTQLVEGAHFAFEYFALCLERHP